MTAQVMEITGVSLAVGRRTLVQDLSLVVGAGELVGVVGANGAGKSTLLRLVAGELRATSGVVRLHGHDIRSLTPMELAAVRAVVPQSSALSFPFSVADVVRLATSVPGHAALHLADGAVLSALEKVGLCHLARRDYATLSGGERQRVHVARALCQLEPALRAKAAPLLLLDEATASLDLAHQLVVMEEARDVARRGGAVIAVLHDLNLAARYCDRVAVMADGKLLVCGVVADAFSAETLSRAYGLTVQVDRVPGMTTPCVLPQRAALTTER